MQDMHMGLGKERDQVSGEEETKSYVFCHCKFDKDTTKISKHCCFNCKKGFTAKLNLKYF